MNITAEQQQPTKPKKPTDKQLKAEFVRLSDLNKERIATYGRNAGPGAFSEIAKANEMTAENVKALLKGGVTNWKKRHFSVWMDCKLYVKKR